MILHTNYAGRRHNDFNLRLKTAIVALLRARCAALAATSRLKAKAAAAEEVAAEAAAKATAEEEVAALRAAAAAAKVEVEEEAAAAAAEEEEAAEGAAASVGAEQEEAAHGVRHAHRLEGRDRTRRGAEAVEAEPVILEV